MLVALATLTQKKLSTTWSEKPSIIIIGSGVIGLTTAYWIEHAAPGRFSVQIVDRFSEPAGGASYQNGGVINVEAIAPLSSYLSFPKTFKEALWSDLTGTPVNTAISFRRAPFEPGMLAWIWHFMRNSTEEAIHRNSETMRALGNLTGPLFDSIAADLGLTGPSHNFAHTPGLRLARVDDPEAAVASSQARWDSVLKKRYVAGEDEVRELLRDSGLCGPSGEHNLAVVEPNNMTINTRGLCRALRSHLAERGVRFRTGTVTGISVSADGNSVSGVELEGGRQLEADAVVVAANFESVYLLRRLGITLPLAPIKAYSLHIHDEELPKKLKYAALVHTPTVHCLITPYRDEPHGVRVTGLRDLDGFNNVRREPRVSALMDAARRYVGDFGDQQDVNVWAGVMAVSPDDFPIVGPTKRFPNLYVNTGHGFRGTNWSLASAVLLARSMGLAEGGGGGGADEIATRAAAVDGIEELVVSVSPGRFDL